MAPKKRKRRRPASARKRGGVMIGMRRQFKKVGGQVAGTSAPQAGSGSKAWLGTALLVVIALAAIGIYFYRR